LAEQANVEVAHHLAEHHEGERRQRIHELLEFLEVTLLAIVAIATAWSGYQAAKWDGRQTYLYGLASTDRFAADSAATLGGQQLLDDTSMFVAWLQARADGNQQLQDLYVRRLSPAYRTAFDAWLSLGLSNPEAPPGPRFMPEYHNPLQEKADRLNEQASSEFEQGTVDRDRGEKYVLDAVLFASVLFLVALAQRFKNPHVRLGANAIALLLLAYVIISVVSLPRA
jgi:hypothetical protein